MYFFPSFFLHPPLPPSFTSKAWQKAQRNLNELKWNKLTRSVFLVLLPKKKKKEYYIVVIKSSFFKLYPVLSKAANFIYDGALRLRVCGLHLFLALHQDTGAGWPSAVLSVTYDLTLTHPASYLQLVVGLKAQDTKLCCFSFFFFLPPTRKPSCATHPIKSQVYCSFHTQVKQPKGKQTSRAGREHLDAGGEDSEFPTLLLVFFYYHF